MIKGKSISLVIPCKNEEKAIAAMLKQVPKYVDEVIVVDNNSSDRTRAIAKKLGAKVFRETRHVDGIGYGFAHQRGIKEATSEYIITMDGDHTYPLKEIKNVILHMEKNGLDFVSCNRFPLQDHTAISRVRQLGVWILNQEVRWLYGYPMQDILSGMWAVKADSAKKLSLSCGGWNLSPEIKLAALMQAEVNFGEYHIHHKYRLGESKQEIWKTGFDHLGYILGRRLTTDNPVVVGLKTFHKQLVKTLKIDTLMISFDQ